MMIRETFFPTFLLALLLFLFFFTTACSEQSEPSPPVAKIIPKTDTLFGDVRIDNYYWLRERENPEVMDYLSAENAYTAAMMKHTEALQAKLYQDLKSVWRP
jgi:oligopeptidase B